MRRFNTTGLCVPEKHYMVDISDRVEQIRAMVDDGDYFCINRGRQYGKTTTLAALERALECDHAVASLDFQGLSHASFETEGAFVRGLCRMIVRRCADALPEGARVEIDGLARGGEDATLDNLFWSFSSWCAESAKPVVLIIDEVDSATNNQVFLDFLAQLRLQYLDRVAKPDTPCFQSVILSGVTDVRHLRSKIRDKDQHKVNSPWNIAADFNVDMSFSAEDIAGMLTQYEDDHATGMDVVSVAREVADWTGGYPFLVSRICQLIDEKGLPWGHEGVDTAAKMLLGERNTLFESLAGKLQNSPELKGALRGMLMEGDRMPYLPGRDDVEQLEMYGFVTRGPNNDVVVANRIFETWLYELFLGDDRIAGSDLFRAGDLGRSIYTKGGRLDMRAVLEGFRHAYMQVFGPPEEGKRFLEEDGRRQFLLFLKPIINGTGNYYIEAQTRDQTRTDVVVDYAGEQFVVELKIWRGPRYNKEGERQIAEYLDYFCLDVGYMLSFNFNHRKEPGLKRVQIGNKVLFEETV